MVCQLHQLMSPLVYSFFNFSIDCLVRSLNCVINCHSSIDSLNIQYAMEHNLFERLWFTHIHLRHHNWDHNLAWFQLTICNTFQFFFFAFFLSVGVSCWTESPHLHSLLLVLNLHSNHDCTLCNSQCFLTLNVLQTGIFRTGSRFEQVRNLSRGCSFGRSAVRERDRYSVIITFLVGHPIHSLPVTIEWPPFVHLSS